MIIYAENIPESWFGHTFEYKDLNNQLHQVKVVGVYNGNTLLAENGDGVAVPYFSLQGFAQSMLVGKVRRVD